MSDTQTGRKNRLTRGSLSELVIDHLTTHGGWHTTAALMCLTDTTAKTWAAHPIARALHRLRHQGLIEARPTGPATRGSPENEWRATDRAWDFL